VALPATGPRVGTYSTLLPLTFTTITAATDSGVYRIQATDASGTVSAQSVDVSAGAAVANFVLTP